MMDPEIVSQLDRAERCWVNALQRVTEADMDIRSGADAWSNRELINHLIGGGVRYAKLLAQAETAEVEATRGLDHLGEDMLESFWERERAFRQIAGECDLEALVAHRIGNIPGTQLVRMRILELALHAADLSRGTGHGWPIDDELADFMARELSELIIELGADGGYKEPNKTRDNATSAEYVLATSGR
jgi:uncharacterized protein (TIGR03086 family)